MAQAASTLRTYEYSALLLKWLDDNLTDTWSTKDHKSPWHLKNEFALSQTLVSVAQLAADHDVLLEIIELAKIRDKVNNVLERMTDGLTDSYAPLLPSILWSATALDIDIEPAFRKKASAITLDNYNKLSYASKVLLGQTITSGNIDCEDSSALKAIKRDAALMQYRYEQIELRDNSRHYKEVYGVDIALEI